MRKCPRCKGKGTLNASHYATGRRFEWKVRDKLQEKGYTVYRAYGSKGILDLIATKGKLVIGIQCKNAIKPYLPPKDRDNIVKVFADRNYTLNYWADNKIRTKDFVITNILHCWGNIEYREYIGTEEWQTYKP